MTSVLPGVQLDSPTLPLQVASDKSAAGLSPRKRRIIGGLVRGRQEDPVWVRPALLVLLVSTGVAYTWALGDAGWANAFYSASVQAGTKSWKAFFFGSSDASNFITVDKPPASLWVMEVSARIFGLSSWSILVPQALEGVASVAILYAAVRRWFPPAAALLAGTVLALTPVAALMFRYNNPDALLVLLLTAAAYATVRSLERASTWWLVAAAALVGTGFITKMLQALLVLPAIGVVFLLAAPVPFWRRVRQLLAAGVALVVSGGWWVAAVQLVPAADRPYIGGSSDNSLLNLIFSYNGIGRLSGNESGSVGGGGAAGSVWGPTGWNRLFLPEFGGQVAWLIPGLVILCVACAWMTRRAPRTHRTRAALVLWGGTFLVTGATISFAKGIIHPYYTVALAPAIGGLAGIGAVTLWQQRRAPVARFALSFALAVTVLWSFVLLDRTPQWLPELRWVVLVLGLPAALALAVSHRIGSRRGLALGAIAVVSALAGTAAYTMDTVATRYSGAIPSAGPTLASALGAFPGGAAAGGAPGLAGRGAGGPVQTFGAPPNSARSTARGSLPAFGRGPSFGPTPAGGQASIAPGSFIGASRGTHGGNGFLNISTPGKDVVSLLERDSSTYSWVAATVNSNAAAGYQLATRDPVMAIGGFNGTDPAPALAQFERYVAAGRIHYFITSNGGGPGDGGTGTTASEITTWVEAHFKAQTIDGETLYDLASR